MTDQENEIKWQEYFYPNTNVLINKYDERDPEKLKVIEMSCSFDRLMELQEKPLDLGCGKEQLLELHKYIFGDVYSFAGKYRTVNMTKNKGGFFFFYNQEDIDKYLDELFSEIEEELEHCYGLNDFSEILAKLYTELIYCHPFREGNGRTIREFIREFSIEKSNDKKFGPVELDWRDVDKDALNHHVEVAHIFPSLTALLFQKALKSKEKTK